MSEKSAPPSQSFEQTISELEAIVTEMEQGDLPLHDALKKFERGIELSRLSQKALVDAEQKVKILTEQNGDSQLQDFSAAQED
ncbi:exodeoxyribonuclease VII small subunit [Alteromonas gilva]|uniref:exodeoxyribonuclease VII small subunit n=1 Tax=Alteromonas gilva TaxID=2987522 RepID=UPI0035AB695E